MRLHNRRGGTGMGPAPLMWSEIDAFQRLTGTALSGWEVEVIEALDNAWARVTNDKKFSPFEDEEG